jgi:CBS domain-containing protein
MSLTYPDSQLVCIIRCKAIEPVPGVLLHMQVRDGMSTVVLTVGPGHTLRQAAAQMTERNVGAAIVMDPDAAGPGIITERDILQSLGRGEDPDSERVSDHLTGDLVYASPTWSLEQAAVAMVRGAFRHLIVIDGGEIAGILSVRDIVRCWTDDGASCDLPQQVAV